MNIAAFARVQGEPRPNSIVQAVPPMTTSATSFWKKAFSTQAVEWFRGRCVLNAKFAQPSVSVMHAYLRLLMSTGWGISLKQRKPCRARDKAHVSSPDSAFVCLPTRS